MSPALPSTELPFVQCCHIFIVSHVISHCWHCFLLLFVFGAAEYPRPQPPQASLRTGSPRRQMSHRLTFALSRSCWQRYLTKTIASIFYKRYSPPTTKLVRTEPFPPAIFGVLRLFPVRFRLAIRIYGHGAQQREALLLRLRPVR